MSENSLNGKPLGKYCNTQGNFNNNKMALVKQQIREINLLLRK